MSLCKYCQSIPPDLFSYFRETQCTINHQPSYLALEQSAAAGCDLCALFTKTVQVHLEETPYFVYRSKWEKTESVTVRSTKLAEQILQVGFKEVGKFRGREVPLDWKDPVGLRPRMRNDEHLEHEAAIIKHWLEICPATHKECGVVPKREYLPTRVIQVGPVNGRSVRLCLSSGLDTKTSRYLALSHCWGSAMSNSAKTTMSTLKSRLDSIDLDVFPQTFVDFIHLARRLNVPYVWIDSLCIIQDSKADWENEVGLMASVYSNAYLTIAASSSSDGSGGCHILTDYRPFGPVDLDCTPPVDVKSSETNQTTKPESKNRKFRIYSLPSNPIANILQTDPLTGRGWTLQERELSPRVVHYSKDSMRWECHTLKASLEFPWGDSVSFNSALRIFDAAQLDNIPSTPILAAEDEKKLLKHRLAWFDLVLRYTKRNLTKQSDILPGISGIAQSVQKITSDTYYAGIWKSYFVNSLLWSISWNMEQGLKTHSRPASYLAPSWSWASVKGPIHYEWGIHSEYCHNPTPDPEFMPIIHRVEVETAASDAFGALKAGHVELEGKIKTSFTRGEGYAVRSERQERQDIYTLENGVVSKMGFIKFDVPLCPDCSPPGKPKVLLLLCCLPRKPDADGSFDTVGLALQVENLERAEFSRIGIVYSIKPDWWADSNKLRLTIL